MEGGGKYLTRTRREKRMEMRFGVECWSGGTVISR
jgi:hypothetical protein